MLAKSRAELLDAKFLAARFPLQRVVSIAGFFANQVNDFFLLFALCHFARPSAVDT